MIRKIDVRLVPVLALLYLMVSPNALLGVTLET